MTYTELHERLVTEMRAHGHRSYEDVANDVIPVIHDVIAEELTDASNELARRAGAPGMRGIVKWLRVRAHNRRVAWC